jgi:hypothetical protein
VHCGQQRAQNPADQKSAATLIRKIRKTGLHPELARDYILSHAPAQHQDDYVRMWLDFCDEAQATLLSDFDYELKDAQALLRRECNVSQGPSSSVK